MSGEYLCSFQATYHLVEPLQVLTFSREKRMFSLRRFKGCSNKNATRTTMTGQLLYKVEACLLPTSHSPSATHHPAEECGHRGGRGYEDPEAPSACTKAALPDWFFTRAQELHLMVPHRHSSYRTHTGSHDWWREQAGEATALTVNAELFRAVGTRPFRKSWVCDQVTKRADKIDHEHKWHDAQGGRGQKPLSLAMQWWALGWTWLLYDSVPNQFLSPPERPEDLSAVLIIRRSKRVLHCGNPSAPQDYTVLRSDRQPYQLYPPVSHTGLPAREEALCPRMEGTRDP